MVSLHMRMCLLLAALFAIIYSIIVLIGTSMGYSNFNFYFILSLGMMFFQYMIGPKMVEMSMRIRYLAKDEHPNLHAMIQELSQKANIPTPRLCISELNVPNAFAFGRGQHDGRVCVTQGILKLLNEEELKAVIGHELAHIKNRDVITITILSVIPMILYRIAWQMIFYSGRSRNRGNNNILIGMVAFLFYFISNLLVLYASRIREYYADKGSIEMGNQPSALASALYKLVYGSARTDKDQLRESEGLKAFFINDPSRARNDIRELRDLDINQSGSIDKSELEILRNQTIQLTSTDKLMELMSTHPNMLKRIQHLSKQGL